MAMNDEILSVTREQINPLIPTGYVMHQQV